MLRFIYILPLSLLLFFIGCSHAPLDVETRYFTYSDLASVRAFTPDPKKQMGNIPEQYLYIRWIIPQRLFKENQFSLGIKVRYGNLEEESYLYPISKRREDYHFSLDQNTYIEKGGIATYSIQIMNGEIVYAVFNHPVWTDLLPIQE
jgi:hypothetical protein